jgi:hypothetical protein
VSRCKKKYCLQHKYPWEVSWHDIAIEGSMYNDEFHSILKTEPSHLIEVEYRIMEKKNVNLRFNGMKVIKPIPCLDGRKLSIAVEEFKGNK